METHLHDIKQAWCEQWNANAVEDSRQMMDWCDNPKYNEIRKEWYGRVKQYTKALSVHLGKVLEDVVGVYLGIADIA